MQPPFIVVPNPSLLGGHQDEFAAALQDQKVAVWGTLGYVYSEPEPASSLRDHFSLWNTTNSVKPTDIRP